MRNISLSSATTRWEFHFFLSVEEEELCGVFSSLRVGRIVETFSAVVKSEEKKVNFFESPN